MGIKFVERQQALFVITDEECDRNDRPPDSSRIGPHDADDAEFFEKYPQAGYLIREWRYSDAAGEHEHSDLLEAHCMTIVFRSGWRERVPFFYRNYSKHYPFEIAFGRAWDMIDARDPKLGPYWDLPDAGIVFAVCLMGRPPRKALKILRDREKARLAAKAQEVPCAALATV